jgi:hypothetical protein
MSRIIITPRAYANGQMFIEYLQDYFYRFYSNTGLEAEREIQARYEFDSDILLDQIIDEIGRCLTI